MSDLQSPTPGFVSLTTLAGGVAEELFQAAFDLIVSNIDDPNTDWKQKRKITLSIEFSTNEERRQVFAEVKCQKKLAEVKPVGTILAIGRHKGRLVAREALEQREMFPEPEAQPRLAATNQEV